MILSLKDKVWWFAVVSRGFVLILSAVSNFVLPDHTADAFITPKQSNGTQETYADYIVNYMCGGFVRWDAQYFLHISMYGYTYENCLAFFPLFPLLSRVAAQALYLMLGTVLSELSLHIISALCINWLCFIKSASILYDLSLRVLRNEKLAYRACIFYCVNPASIFFSALYSESLYACLTFYGMLKCGCGFSEKFSVDSGIIFGLSAITRSNGILNIGFVAYKCLKTYTHNVLPKFLQELRDLKIQILWMLPVVLLITSAFALPYLLSTVISLLPFVIFQVYGYYKYCISHNHTLPEFLDTFAKQNNLIVPGGELHEENEIHWCNTSIPFSYSYIQSHYWNVGFLKYYQWKQIPNFILAVPIVWIIVKESYKYILQYRKYCISLGLKNSQEKISIAESTLHVKDEKHLPANIFPYVIHALFLTLFSVTCAHVQVTTRLISSSSPVLYWFCAKMSTEESLSSDPHGITKLSTDLKELSKRKLNKKDDLVRYDVEPVKNMCSYWRVFVLESVLSNAELKFIHLYFLCFTVIGTILFSNFLPWT